MMSSNGLTKWIIIFMLSNAHSSHHKVTENYTLVIPSENCKVIETPYERILDHSLLKKNCYNIEQWREMRIEEDFSGIDPNLFKHLPNIEVFKANHLNLSKLILKSFNLATIDLSKNKMRSFKLIANDKLSSLDLSFNELVNFSLVPIKVGKPSLEDLNLSHNNIQELDSISRFENLKIFDLSWNKMRKLREKIFSRLKKLEIINLSHNKLSSLPQCLICAQENLEYLDLSYNNIKTITGLYAPSLINLKVIHLAENPVDISNNVMLNFMEKFVNVKEITIAHEKFSCTPENVYSNSKSSCFKSSNSAKRCCAFKKKRLRRSISNSHFHATINNKKMAHNVSAIASKTNETIINNQRQDIPEEFFDKLHNMNMKNVNTSLNATLRRIDLGVSELEDQYSNIINKFNKDISVVNSKLNELNETFNDIFLEISNLNNENLDSVNPDTIKKDYEDVIYLLTLCLFLLLISICLSIFRIVLSLRRSRTPKECTMGLLNLESVDHN